MAKLMRSSVPVTLVFTLIGVFLLLSAVFGDAAGGGNSASGDSPLAFPELLLTLWVLLGLAALVADLQKLREPAPETDGQKAFLTRALPVGLTVLVMAIAVGPLGYFVTIVMGLPIILFLVGERRPVPFLLAFLLLGPGLWALFHHLLEIRLPTLLSGGLL